MKKSDPADPQRPNVVNEWIAIFMVRGRVGLEEAFHAYAEKQWSNLPTDDDERADARESWELMKMDKMHKTHHVLSLLQTLPDFVILALLRCDLPRQMAQDPNVNDYVVKYMGLTEHPSIFMNLLHDGDGLFLSSVEMEQLLIKMERYLTVDAEPRQDQVEIDNSLSPWKSNAGEPQLRFRGNDRAEKTTREWIALARKTHCTDLVDSSSRSCVVPSEVGWAINAKDYCKAHKDNLNSSCIFGLVNAILRMPSALGGFDFPPPLQILLFPIWERNFELFRVARILGCCLTSSYSSLGGLNCQYAGSEPDHEQEFEGTDLPADDSPHWEANAQSFLERLSFEKPGPADMQKARDWNDTLLRAAKLNTTESARKKAEEERDGLATELNAKKGKRSYNRADLLEQMEAFGREQDAAEAEWQKRLQELREKTRRLHQAQD